MLQVLLSLRLFLVICLLGQKQLKKISWCVEEQDHTGRIGVVRVVIRKIDLHAAFFSSLYIQFFLIILENCELSLPSPFGSC